MHIVYKSRWADTSLEECVKYCTILTMIWNILLIDIGNLQLMSKTIQDWNRDSVNGVLVVLQHLLPV